MATIEAIGRAFMRRSARDRMRWDAGDIDDFLAAQRRQEKVSPNENLCLAPGLFPVPKYGGCHTPGIFRDDGTTRCAAVETTCTNTSCKLPIRKWANRDRSFPHYANRAGHPRTRCLRRLSGKLFFRERGKINWAEWRIFRAGTGLTTSTRSCWR